MIDAQTKIIHLTELVRPNAARREFLHEIPNDVYPTFEILTTAGYLFEVEQIPLMGMFLFISHEDGYNYLKPLKDFNLAVERCLAHHKDYQERREHGETMGWSIKQDGDERFYAVSPIGDVSEFPEPCARSAVLVHYPKKGN
jgi:hypothetical protein